MHTAIERGDGQTMISIVSGTSPTEHRRTVISLVIIGWFSARYAKSGFSPSVRAFYLDLLGWCVEAARDLLTTETANNQEPGNARSAVVSAATTRADRMAFELQYALANTSSDDLRRLSLDLASDLGSALGRRVQNLLTLIGRLVSGTLTEGLGLANAYFEDRAIQHLGERLDTAKNGVANALRDGVSVFRYLATELLNNPAEAAPKLLVLVFASVAASGGVDGNGGIPDSDIPLMGIGAHRSPFTHSIIIGSILEAGLMLLTRIVLCAHKNLPAVRDPLWDTLVQQSVGILNAAGKGASIGIAYHLMVDAVVQPGPYHGVPFDMPIEAHQAVFAANSVSEATAVRNYPDEETLSASPTAIADHKKYRSKKLTIEDDVRRLLTESELTILDKYGAWLAALAGGVIQPTTISQVRFLKVVNEDAAPESKYELAWAALTEALTIAATSKTTR